MRAKVEKYGQRWLLLKVAVSSNHSTYSGAKSCVIKQIWGVLIPKVLFWQGRTAGQQSLCVGAVLVLRCYGSVQWLAPLAALAICERVNLGKEGHCVADDSVAENQAHRPRRVKTASSAA